MRAWAVYALYDIDGHVRYVGCTCRVLERLAVHEERFDWIHRFDVLEVVLSEDQYEARTRENYWIHQFVMRGQPLLNQTGPVPIIKKS